MSYEPLDHEMGKATIRQARDGRVSVMARWDHRRKVIDVVITEAREGSIATQELTVNGWSLGPLLNILTRLDFDLAAATGEVVAA